MEKDLYEQLREKERNERKQEQKRKRRRRLLLLLFLLLLLIIFVSVGVVFFVLFKKRSETVPGVITASDVYADVTCSYGRNLDSQTGVKSGNDDAINFNGDNLKLRNFDGINIELSLKSKVVYIKYVVKNNNSAGKLRIQNNSMLYDLYDNTTISYIIAETGEEFLGFPERFVVGENGTATIIVKIEMKEVTKNVQLTGSIMFGLQGVAS